MLSISFLSALGYLAAIAIGLSLGLIGSGGSILTVPVLVYLQQIKPELATTYSLFVVGITSFAGSIQYTRKGLVHYRTVLVFGVPSVISIYLTKLWLVPLIPSVLFTTSGFVFTKDVFIMVLFAGLMLAASISMIRHAKRPDAEMPATITYNYPYIFMKGLTVGLITGLLGAGGGFLIIPALIYMVKLPLRIAVGTSLMIIAFHCLTGFAGALAVHTIQWNFLLVFSTFAVAGIFIGERLARRLSSQQLKPVFGWFVLAMGIYIIMRELVFFK